MGLLATAVMSLSRGATSFSLGSSRGSGFGKRAAALRLRVRLLATEVSASHILVKDEQLLDVARERLRGGESFGEVAADMSECPSKASGGSLGWFQRGQMVPEFDTAAFDESAQVGSTATVKTQFGWHVIRIDGKREIMEASASHILVKDEQLLKEAQGRLQGGESFEAVAADMSECPSKANGGSLGWFQRGQMVPEFEAAAFDESAQVGSTSTVKTQFGWHVIRVDGRREVKAPEQLSPTKLQELLGASGGAATDAMQFVDVREDSELAMASLRLPSGASFFHLPLSEFQSWSPTLKGLDRSRPTIILCHHGIRSMQVATYLVSQRDFVDAPVYNLTGGIDAYAQVDPSVGTYS